MESLQISSRKLDQVIDLSERIATHCAPNSIREMVFEDIVDLFDVDFAASYVWDAKTKTSRDGRIYEIPGRMIETYELHLQPYDPITARMRGFRRAVLADEVMPYTDLHETVFHHEFLGPVGMSSGMNMFLFDGDQDVGDFRIWRSSDRAPFTESDRILLQSLKAPLERAAMRQRAAFRGLTPREAEIAQLVAKGCRDQDISRVLGISISTVRTHLNSAMEKRGCANRAELAFSITASC